MARYIIKRILWVIPIMLGVIIIVFCLRAITPGSPVDQLLGEMATEEQRIELEHQLGLDQPLLQQFFIYVKGVLQGDLGTSYTTHMPVLQELLNRLPTTVIVCFGAVLIGTLLGIPLGVLSAQKQYTWTDSVILVVSMITHSIPNFCTALVLIMIFAVQLHILPAVGISDPRGYILPMVTIGLNCMADYTRITRTSMLEVIRQDYVRTARAKGQTEGMIVWSHELRNAAIPIAASVGNQVGRQLGGALIIETVFGVPGIGKYIGDAVTARNYPAIQGGVIFLAFIFCMVNLIVDISFTVINPQLKTTIINTRAGKIELWFRGILGRIFGKKQKEVAVNG